LGADTDGLGLGGGTSAADVDVVAADGQVQTYPDVAAPLVL
jgi:hypothetical protein